LKSIISKIIAWFKIPRGPYCDGCPYWRPNIAPIKMGDRNMAYCKYLDKTDIDIVKERDMKWTDGKTGEEIEFEEDDLLSSGFASLLWDGCKECGIKEE